jgi:hypothetical protein
MGHMGVSNESRGTQPMANDALAPGGNHHMQEHSQDEQLPHRQRQLQDGAQHVLERIANAGLQLPLKA